jgi:hypothetical protein
VLSCAVSAVLLLLLLHLETEIGWSTVAPVVCPEKALRFVSLINQTIDDQALFSVSRPTTQSSGTN